MKETVRFIHAADLRLGASIQGLRDLSPEWAMRLQSAVLKAYERVVDAALANDVDFVLLVGEVFDLSRLSYSDYRYFVESFERLGSAGISVYLLVDNHDRNISWVHDIECLSETTHILGINGREFALFKQDDEAFCVIGGSNYSNQVMSNNQQIINGALRKVAQEELGCELAHVPFWIGVFQSNLSFDSHEIPASLKELFTSEMDYWACGRLSKRMIFPNESCPRAVFSGSVQACDMTETGDYGCYLVELSQSTNRAKVNLTFIPTSSVVLQQIQVNVSACQTLADVEHLVQAELFRENGKMTCTEMIVRVVLTGQTVLHSFLRQQDILVDLRNHLNNAYPGFFCDVLVDQTVSVNDNTTAMPLEDMEEGSLFQNRLPNQRVVNHEEQRMFAPYAFPNILSDVADEQRDREDVLINYVQSEFVKRGIAVPSALSQCVEIFNDTAKAFVLDLLHEGTSGDLGKRVFTHSEPELLCSPLDYSSTSSQITAQSLPSRSSEQYSNSGCESNKRHTPLGSSLAVRVNALLSPQLHVSPEIQQNIQSSLYPNAASFEQHFNESNSS